MRRRVAILSVALGFGSCAGATPALAGELDPAFGDGGIASFDASDPEERILDVAYYGDGSAISLVGFLNDGGVQREVLVRYLADGRVDADFGTDGTVVIVSNATSWNRVELDADGAILVSGEYRLVTESTVKSVVRVARFKSDGTVDSGFGASNGKTELSAPSRRNMRPGDAVTSQGNLYLTGSAPAAVGDHTDVFLACLDAQTGARCPEFNDQEISTVSFVDGAERGTSIAVDGSGRLLVGASVVSTDEHGAGLARFERDGALDDSFGDDADGALLVPGYGTGRVVVAVDDASRPIVAGTNFSGLGVARFTPAGDADDFGLRVVSECGSHGTSVVGLTLTAEDVLVACQTSDTGSDSSESRIVALNADGASVGMLDSEFGTQGVVEPQTSDGREIEAEWLGQAPEGRAVLAGAVRVGTLPGDTDSALVEIDRSGAVVPGMTETTAPLRSSNDTLDFVTTKGGYVVLAEPQLGKRRHSVLVAYRQDGTLDDGFGSGGVAVRDGSLDRATELFSDARGRLFVQTENAGDVAELVRVTRRGTLAEGFGSGGSRQIDSVVSTAGSRVTTSGYGGNGILAFVDGQLRRVDADGRVSGFGRYERAGCRSPQGIAEDSKGRILELCETSSLDDYTLKLRRLRPNGARDESFGMRQVSAPCERTCDFAQQLLLDSKDRAVILHLNGDIQRISRSGGRSARVSFDEISDAGYLCTDGLAARPNGGLVAAVCGRNYADGVSVFSINPDLTLDPGFGDQGQLSIPFTSRPQGVTEDPEGRIVFGADVAASEDPLSRATGVIRIAPE